MDIKLAKLKEKMEATGAALDILNYRRYSRELGSPVLERKSDTFIPWNKIKKDKSRYKLVEIEEIDYYDNKENDPNFDRIESIRGIHLLDTQSPGNYPATWVYTNVYSTLCDDEDIVVKLEGEWVDEDDYFTDSFLNSSGITNWMAVSDIELNLDGISDEERTKAIVKFFDKERPF